MSDTFLRATAARAADYSIPSFPLSFATISAEFETAERLLIVDNQDPATIAAAHEAISRRIGEWPCWSRSTRWVSYHSDILTKDQCAAVRNAVDFHLNEPASQVKGAADGGLEFQLNLSSFELGELIGEQALSGIFALAEAHYKSLRPRALARHQFHSPECCWIFARRYTADTRPWFAFHFDWAIVTCNIALTSDDGHEGGRLLAVTLDGVQRIPRTEGSATLHGHAVPHAVTRMTQGSRYSLLLFFGEPCGGKYEAEKQTSPHQLVLCEPATLRELYADGQCHCDGCGESVVCLAERHNFRGLWHCVVGCEFDLCDRCRCLKRHICSWRRRKRMRRCAVSVH